jgi:DNA invertase Pin-like site-specific DNA recombinase
VTRLDRLARSTRDLLNTLAAIAAKGARFRSLADTWADTTTAHGRLILTVLGGLAEFERDLIRARTGEGRARANPQGFKLHALPYRRPDGGDGLGLVGLCDGVDAGGCPLCADAGRGACTAGMGALTCEVGST